MNRQADMMTSLREVGYRLTPQRMMILSTFNQCEGHITAEAIHERVRKEYPFVDISTVYRTLQLLKKLRLVTEADLDHFAIFGLCSQCQDGARPEGPSTGSAR